MALLRMVWDVRTELVHNAETKVPKWLFTISPKMEGGPFLMNIGDTPDLGGGGGVILALSGALVSTLRPRHHQN